jgi:hypothetical protein
MRSWIKMTVPVLVVGLLLVATGSALADTGIINGRIRFETENTTAASAEWTRVYLVHSPVPVPEADIEHGLINHAPTDRINTAHQKFYANVRQHLLIQGFLAGSTLVDADGSFQFTGIDPGRYFVLVAFPSHIHGYKVAWQTPVDVTIERAATVELNRNNLVLPTFSRRYGTAIIKAGFQLKASGHDTAVQDWAFKRALPQRKSLK